VAVLRPAAHHVQKKTAHATEQQRFDVKAAREAWFEGQLDLDPARLIFIDETSASTKMARIYGRAPKGERCLAAIPHGHWKTTTFTAGLRIGDLVALLCSTARWMAMLSALMSSTFSLPTSRPVMWL
jgi:hypothetical protein